MKKTKTARVAAGPVTAWAAPVELPSDGWQSASFDHPRNITFGHARLIYAEPVGRRPRGWVMPGGLRTTDYSEAFGWAVKLDALLIALGWVGAAP